MDRDESPRLKLFKSALMIARMRGEDTRKLNAQQLADRMTYIVEEIEEEDLVTNV